MKSKIRDAGERSDCPINAVVELIGDQWTLLILRDVLLLLKTRFSELRDAKEGVATNILSTRLARMVELGLLDKHPDPRDGRASMYLPTERAIDLIPILLAANAWSDRHQPKTAKYPEARAAYARDPHGAAAVLAKRVRKFRKDALP